MGRTTDSFREVVCPDSGEAFDTPAAAARAMFNCGYQVESGDVIEAIESGEELCGRFWDWKWPVERKGHGRLTPPQVDEIRRRAAAGEKQSGLASEFGVSDSTVSLIRSGKRW